MASTDTGWTKEFPKTHGDYWLRFTDPPSEACMVEVNSRGVFEAGVTGDIRNRVVIDECEWLGPLSASDAEQLSELRRVATETMKTLEHYKERHLVPPYFSGALANLRDALAGVDRTATVQCADCLTWFHKEANHTCARQVKANLRAALNPQPEKETKGK